MLLPPHRVRLLHHVRLPRHVRHQLNLPSHHSARSRLSQRSAHNIRRAGLLVRVDQRIQLRHTAPVVLRHPGSRAAVPPPPTAMGQPLIASPEVVVERQANRGKDTDRVPAGALHTHRIRIAAIVLLAQREQVPLMGRAPALRRGRVRDQGQTAPGQIELVVIAALDTRADSGVLAPRTPGRGVQAGVLVRPRSDRQSDESRRSKRSQLARSRFRHRSW